MTRRGIYAGQTLAFCLFLAGSLVQAAPLYKWIDDQGGVHYSDTVPAGKQTLPVDGNLSIISGPPAQQSVSAPVSDEYDARSEQAAMQQMEAEERDRLIEECEHNRGVDCAQQVDTELGAGRVQAGGRAVHLTRPVPSVSPAH
jgi:hypothetical protein